RQRPSRRLALQLLEKCSRARQSWRDRGVSHGQPPHLSLCRASVLPPSPRANEYDVVIEDLNKVPLYTPLWSLRKLVALVHHLFGGTVFREATPPVAAAVWLSERPLGALYRHIPFQAVSLSTADDLVARGIARQAIRVI